MSSILPCPNPTCPHTFAPDALKGATSLVCPRCGTTYQFRSTKPQAAPGLPRSPRPAAPLAPTVVLPAPGSHSGKGLKPAAPAPAARPPAPAAPPVRPAPPPPLPGRPPAPVVLAMPLEIPAVPVPAVPSVPLAMPVAQEPEHLAFESGGDMVAVDPRRRKPRRARRRALVMTLVTVLIVGGLTAGIVVWGIAHFKSLDQGGDDGVAGNTDAGNFKFASPAGPWKSDREATAKLTVNFSLTRRSPTNSLALFYRDYKTRLPTEAEMLDTALSKLRSYFTQLEWERKTAAGVQLGGQPVALYLEFVGTDTNGVPCSGEVEILAHKGVGYWFFTWCPGDVKETVSPEWDRLRACFALLNNRENWKETPRKPEYQPVEELPFELGYFREVWTPQKADKWDPSAKVAFLGFDPADPNKLASKAANFMLIVQGRADSPKAGVEAAKKYLQDGQKDEYPETVIAPIKDKNGKDDERPANIGTERGYLVRLRMQNSESRERYVVLGIVSTAENLLILKGECEYARMDYWDVEFLAMINSFRGRKK